MLRHGRDGLDTNNLEGLRAPIVFKSTQLPRLHDTRNRIVLKTLHFGQRFQKYMVTHRRRVNGRRNRYKWNRVRVN